MNCSRFIPGLITIALLLPLIFGAPESKQGFGKIDDLDTEL